MMRKAPTILAGEFESSPSLGFRDWLMLLIALCVGAALAVATVPVWLPQLSLTLAGPKPRMFWYLGRSSAFVSYVMLWLSIMLGLMMTSKLSRAWPGGPAALDLHQSFSMLGLAFGIFHAFILMGSRFLHYDVMDVLVPFHSDAYRMIWVGLGQVGLYGMAIVGLSFYIRRRITQRVWRIIHFLSFAIFVSVMVHGLKAGSDAQSLLAQGLYWLTGVSVACLTVYRILSKVMQRQSLDSPPASAEPIQTMQSVPTPAVSVSAFAPATDVGAAATVTIVFGSQSGNCETLAKRTAKALALENVATTVLDGARFKPEQLSQVERLIIITSTYGEGEPPENIAGLYRHLHSSAAPKLGHVAYCVLALGDRSYATFCKAGKDFDARLAALGANRLTNLVTCDVDFEKAFRAWTPLVAKALQNAGAPAAAAKPATASPVIASSSVNIETKDAGGYSRSRPFPARIVHNANLHAADEAHGADDANQKRTHHVSFSLSGSGLCYEPGDVLGVIPTNPLALVSDVIRAAGLYKDAIVALPDGGEAYLVDALLRHYDIGRLTRAHIEGFVERTNDPQLHRLLEDENAAELKTFLYGRELVDLLLAHPNTFKTAEEFIGILAKLNPRMYSISSSQKMYPEEVHLTVGIVRYDSHGRLRNGVCSNDLSEITQHAIKGVFVHTNKSFRLPADPNTPIIMVGPGTGIAPFRGFLQERAATGARGKNWLFFGCQRSSSDFLYRDELLDYQKSGVLTRLDVAASRDQAEKIYVQTLMQRNATELWAWMGEGAYFYVCGDAARMAKDVDVALQDVAVRAGGVSTDDARAWTDNLREQKRYLRDVY